MEVVERITGLLPPRSQLDGALKGALGASPGTPRFAGPSELEVCTGPVRLCLDFPEQDIL